MKKPQIRLEIPIICSMKFLNRKNSESLVEKPFSDPVVPSVIILEAINHRVFFLVSISK
jgi:hypothetical protein